MTVVNKSCIWVFLKILASRFSSRILRGLQLFDKDGNGSVSELWKPCHFHWKRTSVSETLNVQPIRSAHLGFSLGMNCTTQHKTIASGKRRRLTFNKI